MKIIGQVPRLIPSLAAHEVRAGVGVFRHQRVDGQAAGSSKLKYGLETETTIETFPVRRDYLRNLAVSCQVTC